MLEVLMIGVAGYMILAMVMISRRQSRMAQYRYPSAERSREPNPRVEPFPLSSANTRAASLGHVDGSELARAFFTYAALVGAAMCSAW
jgi:hypothetical protein